MTQRSFSPTTDQTHPRRRMLAEFDAFCWAQRNRIRNMLATPNQRRRADMMRENNDGLVRTGMVDEKATVHIERRK